ncbi:MAG: PhzF family isomerase [Desulfovibrio sp.]
MKTSINTISVLLVDAFTSCVGKGNRAGVVLDASFLKSDEMQAIAALVNVSETAFMIPTPESHAFELQVRYFTPTVEVPSCGHATIASHYARSLDLNIENGCVVMKTGAGILPVDIMTEGSKRKIVMTQGQVVFSPPVDESIRQDIFDALGLQSGDILHEIPVQEVSTGHSKIMVPITSSEKLDSLQPDMDALARISVETGCNGFFVFVLNDSDDDCLTSGRMFAPAAGIDEDPVTGNGNGPCGAYLTRYKQIPGDGIFSYFGRQGVAMGKEGVVEVTVHSHDGIPEKVQVGGTAVHAGQILVSLKRDSRGKVSAAKMK